MRAPLSTADEVFAERCRTAGWTAAEIADCLGVSISKANQVSRGISGSEAWNKYNDKTGRKASGHVPGVDTFFARNTSLDFSRITSRGEE